MPVFKRNHLIKFKFPFVCTNYNLKKKKTLFISIFEIAMLLPNNINIKTPLNSFQRTPKYNPAVTVLKLNVKWTTLFNFQIGRQYATLRFPVEF